MIYQPIEHYAHWWQLPFCTCIAVIELPVPVYTNVFNSTCLGNNIQSFLIWQVATDNGPNPVVYRGLSATDLDFNQNKIVEYKIATVTPSIVSILKIYSLNQNFRSINCGHVYHAVPISRNIHRISQICFGLILTKLFGFNPNTICTETCECNLLNTSLISK